MAEPDAAGFKAMFPQFADLTADCIDAWIAQCGLRFTAARFGSQWIMTCYYFAGHNLTLFNPLAGSASDQGVSKGPVTSEKVGDLARSYGATFDMARVSRSLMPYTSTVYGQCLIGIVMSRAAGHASIVRTGTSRLGIVGSTETG